MRWLALIFGTMAALAAWAVIVFFATLDGWTRTPLAPAGDAHAFFDAATARIDDANRGNAVFVLIEDGDVVGEHFISVGAPVDGDTLFQTASLSKWISAWGVMALVDQGALDLDAPVSSYLTRWALPESAFDNDGVTVRRLLSHTAGLTDGLGYGGFAPGEEIQALEDSLTLAADASPGADGRVRVGMEPGSGWNYSGGGYTLLQLLVEEVSGVSFETHMRRAVLAPLGMDRSTYENITDDTPNLAAFYDVDGTEAVHYRFAGLAPTSLYTTAGDMTRFIQAHFAGASTAAVGRGVLAPATVAAMREPHAWEMGAAIWGLGTMLYAPNGSGDFIIGHDGDNEPAINTAVRLNPATGDGIVVLETGAPLMATKLAGEWVFWQTGTIDFLAFTMVAETMGLIVIVGWLVIVLAAAALAWRMTRRRAGA